MTQDTHKKYAQLKTERMPSSNSLGSGDTSSGNVPEKVAKAATLVLDWLIDGPDKEAHSTSKIIEAGETVTDWIHPLG